MVKTIIRIRWKQLIRQFEGIGLFRFLFLAGLAVFFSFIIFKLLANGDNHYYVSAVFSFLIISVHLQRTDKQFLMLISNSPQKIYFSEYLILSLPLISGLLFYKFWTDVLFVFLVIIFTGFINFTPKASNRNNKFIDLIPDNSFEWKAGVRKSFVVLLVVMTAGIAGNFFFVGAVPLAVVVLCFVVINFYQKGEPEQFIILRETGASGFLFAKSRGIFVQFLILISPLIVLFLAVYPGLWYVPVIELFLVFFILVYTVLLKYAFYVPNQKIMASQTLSAIGSLSLFLPFMLPVTWFLSVRFYFKSLSNLEPYLYDFD